MDLFVELICTKIQLIGDLAIVSGGIGGSAGWKPWNGGTCCVRVLNWWHLYNELSLGSLPREIQSQFSTREQIHI